MSTVDKVNSGSFLSTFAGRSEYVAQGIILFFICVLAFCLRLFSVLRYESIIHEFDPWFNFRSTQFLVSEGFYSFHNWFDDMAWYPYGRFVGGTVYPGLMWTAAVFFNFLQNILHFPVTIRNTCVFLSPFMASMTALATYLFTTECWNGGAGIAAAAFIALAPGYVSRSVAGSYDNEAIAIFAMVFCFYLWLRAVNTGSVIRAALAAIGYFYMVAAWGGYVFIINIVPIHVLTLLVIGRFSRRVYISYSVFYLLGTALSTTILFVGHKPLTISPEHLGALGVFGIIQIVAFVQWLKTMLTEKHLTTLFRTTVLGGIASASLLIIAAVLGKIPFFTARLLSLLGSRSVAAIVKSVSEHQPTPWPSFFMDMHCLLFLAPVGIFYIFSHLTDANIFALLYVLFSSYFTSIMIRLMLVSTPAVCVLAGIATNVILTTYTDVITFPSSISPTSSQRQQQPQPQQSQQQDDGGASSPTPQSDHKPSIPRVSSVSKPLAVVILILLFVLLSYFTVHSTFITSKAYSSPTIILMSQSPHGRVIFDDYREAYTWLRHNTPRDAKILSWWDYGYQIAGMAQRTTFVDNNTCNSTQIATAGLILSADEERAYEVITQYGVDYLLVVFGGRVAYNSDDINKFLWIIRITAGIFPEIVEGAYYSAQGQYRVDSGAPPALKQSMMYKMSYYKFNELDQGYDRVRQQRIPRDPITFKYIEEAFTTRNWMLRIYRVKKGDQYPGEVERHEIERQLALDSI